MQTSAFILVLLVGCSAAYYFLDGPPHRHPVRQIIPEVPPPEPKQVLVTILQEIGIHFQMTFIYANGILITLEMDFSANISEGHSDFCK